MGNAAWTGTELLRQRIEGLLAHLFRLRDDQTWHDGPDFLVASRCST